MVTLTRVIGQDRGMRARPAARKDAAGRGTWHVVLDWTY